MEILAAVKLEEFEQGKISRRSLIETLTLAVTTAGVSEAKAAGQSSGVNVALVNHFSYTSPNFRQVADWYAKVFNLEPMHEKPDQVILPFQKISEQPYGVTAKDVGVTYMISRTGDINAPVNNAGAQAPKAQRALNHIAYTVADFDRERAKAELLALGVENVRETGPFRLHVSDPFGYDVQIGGLPLSALTDTGA